MGNGKRVLVCVTQQKTCERLIKIGAGMRDELEGELYIIHVVANGVNFLGNSKEGDALEYLFGISKSVGADLTVLRSNDIIKTITQFSKDNGITDVIAGAPPDERASSIINDLKRKTAFNIHIIPPEKE